MAKLLTISDWQSGNLVLKKTGFKENQLAESILFIWFYGNLVLQKAFLPDMILIYLVLWQSGFTENQFTESIQM